MHVHLILQVLESPNLMLKCHFNASGTVKDYYLLVEKIIKIFLLSKVYQYAIYACLFDTTDSRKSKSDVEISFYYLLV